MYASIDAIVEEYKNGLHGFFSFPMSLNPGGLDTVCNKSIGCKKPTAARILKLRTLKALGRLGPKVRRGKEFFSRRRCVRSTRHSEQSPKEASTAPVHDKVLVKIVEHLYGYIIVRRASILFDAEALCNHLKSRYALLEVMVPDRS
jgi:hypothetical protein